MKRKIIIIGGGVLQVSLIRTALDMFLEPIVFDMSKDAPGMLLASQRIIMSTKDIEGCVREARKISLHQKISGVITAGTDASRAVAAIASALELPGIRYIDAEACSNKVLMRRRLRSFGIPIPEFYSIWSLKEARDAMDNLTFPIVLKPAENMGARGVIKIEKRQDLNIAFKHSKQYSPTGEMIIEEYMQGKELSVDALAWNSFDGEQNYKITGIADRIIEREPFFIEVGHNMPSQAPKELILEAENVMKQSMIALGIHTGAGKGDLKITNKGVMVGEIAARLSGGFMSSHTYPLHSGVNLLKAAIKISLGEDPSLDLVPRKNIYAIERSILSPPGKITKLDGLEKIKIQDNIEYLYVSRKVGDLMPSTTSNIDKLGHVVAIGNTLEEAEESVSSALSFLELEVDLSYGVDWNVVKEIARKRFGDQVCWVCKTCDGANCASGVPGMGGVGNMESFKDNSRALAELYIVPNYIRKPVSSVDTSFELFGYKYEYPIMAAPMTGSLTNMNGAIEEEENARMILKACRENGTMGWVGDGASPEKYLNIMQALQSVDGFGVGIFKPREDILELKKRFKISEDIGLVAVGMDIDAISFKTMILKKQSALARPIGELEKIRNLTKLPFVLKGIMSIEDAYAALEVGVDAIVVSNHGGRVLDQMPGTARVLEGIVNAVQGRIPVLVDGGIRTGQDVFKMLALGANAVLVGRPVAIAGVGGGEPAIKYLFTNMQKELIETMNICGCEQLRDIDLSYVLKSKKNNAIITE